MLSAYSGCSEDFSLWKHTDAFKTSFKINSGTLDFGSLEIMVCMETFQVVFLYLRRNFTWFFNWHRSEYHLVVLYYSGRKISVPGCLILKSYVCCNVIDFLSEAPKSRVRFKVRSLFESLTGKFIPKSGCLPSLFTSFLCWKQLMLLLAWLLAVHWQYRNPLVKSVGQSEALFPNSPPSNHTVVTINACPKRVELLGKMYTWVEAVWGKPERVCRTNSAMFTRKGCSDERIPQGHFIQIKKKKQKNIIQNYLHNLCKNYFNIS